MEGTWAFRLVEVPQGYVEPARPANDIACDARMLSMSGRRLPILTVCDVDSYLMRHHFDDKGLGFRTHSLEFADWRSASPFDGRRVGRR